MKTKAIFLFILIMELAFGQNIDTVNYKYSSYKMGVISGQAISLEGHRNVNLKYDFSEIKVGIASYKENEYLTENDYLKKEGKDKEPGFTEDWERFKKESMAMFEREFNDRAGKKFGWMGVNDATEGDLTLLVKTTLLCRNCYGPPRYPSVDVEFIFKDKAGNELMKIFERRVYGQKAGPFVTPGTFNYSLSQPYLKTVITLLSILEKAGLPEK